MPDFNLFRFQNQLNTKPLEEGLSSDYSNVGRSMGGPDWVGVKNKGNKEEEQKNAATEKNKKAF